jgi:hypothetical protein
MPAQCCAGSTSLRSRRRPTRAQWVVDTGLSRLTAGSIELAKAKSVIAHCLFPFFLYRSFSSFYDSHMTAALRPLAPKN